MKRGLFIGILLVIVLVSFVSAATVSHLAEQVRAGVFGQNYTGNWSFVNGRVGVGTTQPLTALHVNGSTPAGADPPSPDSDKVVIDDNSLAYINFRTGTTGAAGLLFSDDVRGTGSLGFSQNTRDLTYLSVGGFGIGSAPLGYKLYVKGNASINDSFYVTNAGNVGIGTNSPTNNLEVKSAGNTYARITSSATNKDSAIVHYDGTNVAYSGMFGASGGTAGAWGIYTGSGLVMTVLQGGNVGIGTNSPGTKLHVRQASSGGTPYSTTVLAVENSGHAGIGILTGATSYGSLYFGDSGSNTAGGFEYNHATDTLYTRVGGTPRMTINNAGNVGIGTATPGAKLEVSGGNITINSTTGVAFNIYTTKSSSNTDCAITCGDIDKCITARASNGAHVSCTTLSNPVYCLCAG